MSAQRTLHEYNPTNEENTMTEFTGTIQTDLFSAITRHYVGLTNHIIVTISEDGWTLETPEHEEHGNIKGAATAHIPASDWEEYNVTTEGTFSVESRESFYKSLTQSDSSELTINATVSEPSAELTINNRTVPAYSGEYSYEAIDLPGFRIPHSFTLSAPYKLKQWFTSQSTSRLLTLGITDPGIYDGKPTVSFQPLEYDDRELSEDEQITFQPGGSYYSRRDADISDVRFSRGDAGKQMADYKPSETPVIADREGRNYVWFTYWMDEFQSVFQHLLKGEVEEAEYHFELGAAFPVRILRDFDDVFSGVDASITILVAHKPPE